MVPPHRSLAGHHPAGRHLGRTVDARAFSVANVDRRTGPAAGNLESGVCWPALAQSSRPDTSPRMGGSPGRCSAPRELGAGSIRGVHAQVVRGTGLLRLPAGTLGRAGHPRFLARNPGWCGGALLVQAGDFGLRGVLLNWHAATVAGMPRAWPAAYAVVLEVPGFGWFRGPGRYVVLSSLGLCLAAGAGFDRAAGPASIRRGVVTAWAFA